ncbi:hypothetical protein D3C72_579530 [compost metagenome]
MPGVRVGNGFTVFIQATGYDTVACADDRRPSLRARHQAIQPGLETQAVLDDEPGLEQRFGVVRCRLVGVGIRVRADHVGDLDMILANLPGHVGKDAEAGDHLKFFGGR